ncbi:MAG: phosphoenolpyruvate--protein phosphotransferase [Lachnospiraceae bacterium]|nr:phosphoenolpyruvate--protein phosphotransferase [Lachnospiraceae bacterium]
MVKYQGKGVYGAIAIGKALKWKREDVQVKREKIEDVAQELERLRNAINKAMEQLESIYEKALEEVGEANAQIFEIHRMMLEDDDYNDAIVEMIQGQNVNAEYAVAVTADNFAEMFSAIDDSYMQARAADVRDISNRLILCLKETGEKSLIADEKVIICADDLAPSETVTLEKDKVLAFVTAYGSSNSHTAILARNMNIPAIIGVGEEFLNAIEDGEVAIANGFTGEFILHPDEEILEEAKAKQRQEEEKKELLEKLKGKENVTLDGTKINIYANIGSVEDVGAVLVNDAGGIGLFRSEFLYLGREDYPSEEEQFKAYKRVLESMASKKVIIRTLDIGADKQADYFNLDKEENPALGLRAIRLCLTRPEMFKTQLRALYRASVYGKLGIMFPMITSTEELEQIFALCEEVKAELTADGLKYSDTIELGIMIETPAAAVISDQLAPMVDFFSVGTNDLTQYTLACDRQNPKVDPFCNIHHEAILRLIEMAAQNAHKNGAWIGICGELAADTRLTERFLRMGIDELSVSPSFVLKVRDVVRKLDLHNA